MNSGTTLLLPVWPKSFSLYMNKVSKNLYIKPLLLSLPRPFLQRKKPPRTISVLGGFIRYFGFVLEGSGNLYANKP